MILQFTDHADLEKQGRPFRCSTCLINPQNKKERLTIANARKCFEDRWDLSEGDGAAFPIQMVKGGPTFSFCPAKVLRDDIEAVHIFQMLIAILETGRWPVDGGLDDQEALFVELVAEFAQLRRDLEFNERFSRIAKGLNNGAGKNKAGS